MGRVSSYDGWDYTWTRGKLSSIRKNTGSSSRAIITPVLQPNKTYSFTYNAFGQRVSKSYSYFWLSGAIVPVTTGEITNYNKQFKYDASGRLIAEIVNETQYNIGDISKSLKYLYDESGMIGVQYTNGSNTNTYYYLRNLQGDVIAIYDTNGNKKVSYSYDAWGNCTIDSSTTNYELAHDNPIRYRGYYYDEDTGLYYLNSRYYSPKWRRFISPDDTAYLDPENVNGLNLYCYCGNDPVNYADLSGHSVIAAILIGLGIGVAAGLGYAAYTDYQDNYNIDGSIGWQRYLGYSIIGGAIGAGIGLPIGYFGPALAAAAGSAISSFFAFGAGNALALAGGGTSSVIIADVLKVALAAGVLILFAKRSKQSGKATSSDHPSWVNENMIDPNKSPQQNATDILNSKYGPGSWRIGPKSEFNQIVKWIERHLRYYKWR